MNKEIEIEKKEKVEKKIIGTVKKRGRKPKNYKEEYQINTEQNKFFVDLSKEKKALDQVFQLLETANKKSYGREVTFKDLALFGIEKINSKDVERIQDGSLSEMEKVERALDIHNKKHGTKLDLGEFLVKKLSIS